MSPDAFVALSLLVFNTVDVSALAAKTSDAKFIPSFAFNFKNLPRSIPARLPTCIYQSFALLRLFTIYSEGATPNPCPKVPSLPVPDDRDWEDF